MEKMILDAHLRKEFGKRPVKSLRKSGFIPAVTYKHGGKATSLKVDRKEFIKALHTKAGENILITLKIHKDEEGKKPTTKVVIVKDLQIDPVRDEVIHIDFNEVSMTEQISVKVNIDIKGEAVGVKRDGGMLEHNLWELDIECLPNQIPEKIEIDISDLEIGKDIHVKDIVTPEGVKIEMEPDTVVLSVKPPKEEDDSLDEEEAGAQEPEVIREKKPDSEESGS